MKQSGGLFPTRRQAALALEGHFAKQAGGTSVAALNRQLKVGAGLPEVTTVDQLASGLGVFSTF